MNLQNKLLSKLATLTSYKSAVTSGMSTSGTSTSGTVVNKYKSNTPSRSLIKMKEVGGKDVRKPISTGNELNGVRSMEQPVIGNVLKDNNCLKTTNITSPLKPLNKTAASYIAVEGYPGYFVSREGIVYSNHYGSMNPLKPRLAHNGYQRVYMRNSESNKREDQYIHRLVAKAYLKNKENYTVVNHKDCNRSNNNVDNLEWTTSAGNNIYTLDNNRAYRDEFGRFHSV